MKQDFNSNTHIFCCYCGNMIHSAIWIVHRGPCRRAYETEKGRNSQPKSTENQQNSGQENVAVSIANQIVEEAKKHTEKDLVSAIYSVKMEVDRTILTIMNHLRINERKGQY